MAYTRGGGEGGGSMTMCVIGRYPKTPHLVDIYISSA
eukprot:SAG11_NODE_16822_length_535_cov_1.702517_1_plen_36_part_10